MRDDALPIRRLVFIGCGFAGMVVCACSVAFGTLSHRHLPVGGMPVARPAPLGGDLPMLQASPQRDLAAYRQEKSRELDRMLTVGAASGAAR